MQGSNITPPPGDMDMAGEASLAGGSVSGGGGSISAGGGGWRSHQRCRLNK